MLYIRPEPTDLKAEECCLRVSIQPLRLNIDQVGDLGCPLQGGGGTHLDSRGELDVRVGVDGRLKSTSTGGRGCGSNRLDEWL